MKSYLFPLLCLLGTFLLLTQAMAQRNNNLFTVTNSNLFFGEAVDVFDLRERSTEGQTFWDESWKQGLIVLKDSQQIRGYPLRYDLFNETIEIKTGQDIKVLPVYKVFAFFRFEGGDTLCFLDLASYLDLPPDPAIMGLSQLYYEGQTVLVKHKKRELLKANYVPALDAGNVNDKIIFTDEFLLFDGQGLMRVPKRRGKMNAELEDRNFDLTGFLKKNKINPRKAEDLILLCQKLDELLR